MTPEKNYIGFRLSESELSILSALSQDTESRSQTAKRLLLEVLSPHNPKPPREIDRLKTELLDYVDSGLAKLQHQLDNLVLTTHPGTQTTSTTADNAVLTASGKTADVTEAELANRGVTVVEPGTVTNDDNTLTTNALEGEYRQGEYQQLIPAN